MSEKKYVVPEGMLKAMESLVVISLGRCTYCGEAVKTIRCNPLDPRGFDHRIPRSKGGARTFANLVVCCRKCNELKGGSDA